MWWVYIAECNDGSYYCGITNNLPRRFKQHNTGRGAKYTRGRGPIELKIAVQVENKSNALRIEAQVKKKTKNKKIKFLLEKAGGGKVLTVI